mmetsp:Transcript_148882/g.478284  ORF Transcript_148882/g.478284 Transcript_148882/m.478284 type:complete len:258 (-) Transcript_148882:12-785(-)
MLRCQPSCKERCQASRRAPDLPEQTQRWKQPFFVGELQPERYAEHERHCPLWQARNERSDKHQAQDQEDIVVRPQFGAQQQVQNEGAYRVLLATSLGLGHGILITPSHHREDEVWQKQPLHAMPHRLEGAARPGARSDVARAGQETGHGEARYLADPDIHLRDLAAGERVRKGVDHHDHHDCNRLDPIDLWPSAPPALRCARLLRRQRGQRQPVLEGHRHEVSSSSRCLCLPREDHGQREIGLRGHDLHKTKTETHC